MDLNADGIVECIFFDGKTDSTLTIEIDENGRRKNKTILEEHITMVAQPGNRFLGHVAPDKRDAKTTAESIWDF